MPQVPEPPTNATLIAVDVGNSRVKVGSFDLSTGCVSAPPRSSLPIASPPLPEPSEVLAFDSATDSKAFLDWLRGLLLGDARAAIVSVNRESGRRVVELLNAFRHETGMRLGIEELAADRLPMETRVAEPRKVGVDRLVAAVAAGRLRRPEKPAIVVDLGTAITIDLVAADGVFEGGAILPGVAMSARALHQDTDLLPERPMHELDGSPDAVGKNTQDAIDAGLFWGAVGAVREVIARQSDRLIEPPQVFVTGGAAPSVARLLGGPGMTVRHVPDLVLSGIAVSCQE